MDAQEITKPLNLLVDLDGQFTGRNDDHGTSVSVFRKQLQQGYGKRSCFSCTCLGTCYQVPTFKNGWNSLLLDGCCLFKTHIRQCFQQLVVQP